MSGDVAGEAAFAGSSKARNRKKLTCATAPFLLHYVTSTTQRKPSLHPEHRQQPKKKTSHAARTEPNKNMYADLSTTVC